MITVTKSILWSNLTDNTPDNANKVSNAVNKLLDTSNKTEVISMGFKGYCVIGNETAKKRYTMLVEALDKEYSK